MNIIIPLGGKGERFLTCGYSEPKPLITILGKPMIFYVLDNLQLTDDDKIYIIYYNIEKTFFENKINKKYPNIEFVQLEKQTMGASETILTGLDAIISKISNKKTILLDCDTFYTQDIISMYRNIDSNAVFYVNNIDTNPIFSYITLDDNNKITKIAEKNKISDNANTGIYCFNDVHVLHKYAHLVVSNNIHFKNECYTSCIIDQMIKDANSFIGIELDSKFVFNLGTPKQLTEYIDKTHIFLLDLDGTLVISEHIYFEIWKIILSDYNILLTSDIFQKYISGNNDKTVIDTILPQLHIDVEMISKRKDELFIKNIDKIKIIDGVYDMLSTIKKHGHRIALVTNCNRVVSELILNILNIHDFFEFIIIGNECTRAKPYPDPYKEAINRFSGSNEQTIIFEDSKSGLLSANGVSPKCIVGIETIYSSKELKKYYANVTMSDFLEFNLESIIHNNKKSENISLKRFIQSSLKMSIKNIHISDVKLKGGFISDVIDVQIETETEMLPCVLKLENKNENFLSTMSKSLDLYNREYYFYESISKYVPINYPTCYGIIKDDNFNNIGILMENLNNDKYILNLNLNNESINTSLKIIESLAILHAKFWNKPLTDSFEKLKKNNDAFFCPYWTNFIQSKFEHFKSKWYNVLTHEQLNIAQHICDNFSDIQSSLSDTNLTLCHGDVKSPNIFYKITQDQNTYEPYFIDWQYIVNGKGVQDLVFFMIESFDIEQIKIYKNLFKEYYYVKLVNSGIKYDRNDYEMDFANASYYFPFFVAIWFGTISEDELIDKSFPFEFIKKLFHFYSI